MPAIRPHVARTLAALVVLAAAYLLRFGPALRFPAPLGDELVYDQAFARVANGGSAYDEPGFLYPPIFARVGAAARAWGGMAPLYLLRALGALGLLTAIWLSTSFLDWGLAARLAAAIVVLWLSPAVVQGVTLGNVSFLVAGLVIAALCVWPRRPALAGILLGTSLAVKPLAAAAVVVLGLHRRAAPGRAQRIAAGVAIAVAAVALLALPGWREFLVRGAGTGVLASTVAPHRFLVLVDALPLVPWLSVVLLGLLAWGLRRRTLAADDVVATAVAACVVSTPMVWNHTLVLTLPLQAMALQRSLARRGWVERPRWIRETALVALGIATLHLAEGATGITDRSAALQAFAALPIVAAPGLLLAYVLRARAQAP